MFLIKQNSLFESSYFLQSIDVFWSSQTDMTFLDKIASHKLSKISEILPPIHWVNVFWIINQSAKFHF